MKSYFLRYVLVSSVLVSLVILIVGYEYKFLHTNDPIQKVLVSLFAVAGNSYGAYLTYKLNKSWGKGACAALICISLGVLISLGMNL